MPREREGLGGNSQLLLSPIEKGPSSPGRKTTEVPNRLVQLKSERNPCPFPGQTGGGTSQLAWTGNIKSITYIPLTLPPHQDAIKRLDRPSKPAIRLAE